MTSVIVAETDQLAEIIKKTVRVALLEHEAEKRTGENRKTFTRNQVARMLGKSHATISKMIRRGVLHATADNLILESELQKYLGK